MDKTYDEVIDEMAMYLGERLNLSTRDVIMMALTKMPPPARYAIFPVAKTVAYMFDMDPQDVSEDLQSRVSAYINYLKSDKS